MDDQGGSAVPTLASLARESFYRLFADEAIPLVLPLALASGPGGSTTTCTGTSVGAAAGADRVQRRTDSEATPSAPAIVRTELPAPRAARACAMIAARNAAGIRAPRWRGPTAASWARSCAACRTLVLCTAPFSCMTGASLAVSRVQDQPGHGEHLP